MRDGIDWNKLFALDASLLELIIRGSAIYFSVFLLLRFVIRRQVGSIGTTDIIVFLLIASAAENALQGGTESLTSGLVLILTISFWAVVFEWLGFKFRKAEKIINAEPLILIRNGKPLRENLRAQLITETELLSKVRQQGVEHFSEVKIAFLEENGEISVIPKSEK